MTSRRRHAGVSVKGVVIYDMKTFLAKKKQERDQRSKLVKEP